MDPATGASGSRRSRKLFSWRPTRSDTRRVDQRSPTTDKQAVTGSDKEQAATSQVTSPQPQTTETSNDLNAGLPAQKELTETLIASRKDASKQDKVPGLTTRRFGEFANTIHQTPQYSPHPVVVPTLTADLAGKVKGMYRLLDLI